MSQNKRKGHSLGIWADNVSFWLVVRRCPVLSWDTNYPDCSFSQILLALPTNAATVL